MDIKQGVDRLKQKFNEDPILVVVVGSLVATSAAKLIDSLSAAQGRRAYAKQVRFRVSHNR